MVPRSFAGLRGWWCTFVTRLQVQPAGWARCVCCVWGFSLRSKCFHSLRININSGTFFLFLFLFLFFFSSSTTQDSQWGVVLRLFIFNHRSYTRKSSSVPKYGRAEMRAGTGKDGSFARPDLELPEKSPAAFWFSHPESAPSTEGACIAFRSSSPNKPDDCPTPGRAGPQGRS